MWPPPRGRDPTGWELSGQKCSLERIQSRSQELPPLGAPASCNNFLEQLLWGEEALLCLASFYSVYSSLSQLRKKPTIIGIKPEIRVLKTDPCGLQAERVKGIFCIWLRTWIKALISELVVPFQSSVFVPFNSFLKKSPKLPLES